MIRPLLLLPIGLLLGTAAGAAEPVPWHADLSYAGGGYWRCRVPVVVSNETGRDAQGRTVEVRVGREDGELDLAGQSVASLRVCDSLGGELLYDLIAADGAPRREGTLAEGDRLLFGVECTSGASVTYYVYAENPEAAAVPDFLGAASPFMNGSFEEGADAPRGWQPAESSDQHRLAWVEESPHSGRRCVRCVVAPGAVPNWVKWMQENVGVVPDADYRLEAWVKAKDAKGGVGWFVHVHGAKPMVVNQVANAGEGTYDWKRVEIAFHTPPDAARATIGTMLHGAGTAWYDDAALVLLTKATPLRAAPGKLERTTLTLVPAFAEWRMAHASHRAELRVRNWSDLPMRPLAHAELALLLRSLPRTLRQGQIRVLDPSTGDPVPSLATEDRLLFAAQVPARAEKTYHAYFYQPGLLAGREPTTRFADIADSPANLVSNPGFEDNARIPAYWTLSAESQAEGGKLYRAARDSAAHGGRWCVRLEVPPGAPLAWSGWHQSEIPVQPRTTYLYGAYVRCKDVADGSVQLHGHFHNAAGKLCEAAKYFSVGPPLSGTQDWTLLLGLVQTPADCLSVELHLTMNAHGTVWYDEVLFCEAAPAMLSAIRPHRTTSNRTVERRGYAVWAANPVVKIFRDDLIPSEAPEAIELAAARNEWEVFQIAVRALRDLRDVDIVIEPPALRDGTALRDISLRLVGYVPVDYPSNYYTTRIPSWYRRLPRGASGCDGWPGLWPDPLPPYKAFSLEGGKVQPVWGIVRVPADAKAGTYHGSLTLQPANADAVKLPFHVTVWDFALPKASHLKVIYDFREGAIDSFGGTRLPHEDALRRWYAFLAAHRISPGLLPAPKFGYKDGQVTMDTAEFDRAAAYCLDELGVNVFYTPWLFYSFGWAHKPPKLFGFEPFTKEYTEAYTRCLKTYMDHLRSKGWADKAILYVSDEPHFSRPEVIEQMKQVCAMIRSVEPGAKIYSSTWNYVPQWAGAINVWGAGPHGSFPVETMRERREAGDEIWFTTDGHQCLDTPYCAIERLLPWLCWKYGASAYEFWGVNWWTYDPWERGWHTFISQSDDGVSYYYVRYPNGDGYLTYPGARAGVDGPVGSIRLEQVREGVEDYEYLWLLDQLIADAKARRVSTREAERVRRDAAALVSIPNRGGRYSTSLLPDPDAVPRLRTELGRTIERLSRRLR